MEPYVCALAISPYRTVLGMLVCPLQRVHLCVAVCCWFLLHVCVSEEKQMPFLPHTLPLTSHHSNRAVTLLLNRSESINTRALLLSPRALGPWVTHGAALHPLLPHRCRRARIGSARACVRWQPCPKSLGRSWRGASQLSRGQN